MINDNILDRLKELNGYMASAITDIEGNILISNIGEKSKFIGDSFTAILNRINQTFVENHKVTKELKLGCTNEMLISTENSFILFTCTGESTNNHQHIFVVLDRNANEAFARMVVKRMVKEMI